MKPLRIALIAVSVLLLAHVSVAKTKQSYGLSYDGLTFIATEEGSNVTEQQTAAFENEVNNDVTVPLTQNQFDALVSLCFNIGVTAFRDSTLLNLLNAGDYNGAAAQFSVWININGAVSQGLVNRRNAEKDLFLQT